MSQAQVKEVYLRVIDATIEGAKAEFAEKGADDATLASLETLRERWALRLTQSHDFTDDPSAVAKPAAPSMRGAKGKAAAAAAAAAATAAAASASRDAPQRSGISVAALTNGPGDQAGYPAGFHQGPGDAAGSDSRQLGRPVAVLGEAGAGAEPPAKRARVAMRPDDIESENGGENLDSSDDSDVASAGSDPDTPNYVLCSHDKVKKGSSGKWKVALREGIACINGREYVLHKASAELEWGV